MSKSRGHGGATQFTVRIVKSYYDRVGEDGVHYRIDHSSIACPSVIN
jgi:hypothetical protein